MYELPEIEIVRRELDKEVGGKKVRSFEIGDAPDLVAGPVGAAQLVARLEGAKLGPVRRTGLVLTIDVGDDEVLVVDLGDGARLRRAANKDAEVPGTIGVINFTQGGQLRLIDPDGVARLALGTKHAVAEVAPAAAGLGLDPIDEPIAWVQFGKMVLPRPEKLKALLMDPGFLVGIGPIYSDEILHDAGLRGDRTGDSLTTQEVRRLYRALVETLHNAMKQRGTSLADGYLDLHGEPGGYAEHLAVYGRAGGRSRNGRGEVAKMKVGRSTHFYAEYQV